MFSVICVVRSAAITCVGTFSYIQLQSKEWNQEPDFWLIPTLSWIFAIL